MSKWTRNTCENGDHGISEGDRCANCGSCPGCCTCDEDEDKDEKK